MHFLQTVSHGAPGMQENMVTTGITVPAEEGPASDSDTVRRFKGMLDLSKAPATSFQSYNIEVSVCADWIPQEELYTNHC
jgi:hypothetical protein